MAKKFIKAIPTNRIDTASNWSSANPILESGEVAYELDPDGLPGKYKVGNGTTSWNYLPYFSRKKLNGSVTASNYYTFAQTEINPGSYYAKFRIVITSTADATIEHELIVEVLGNKNYTPTITGVSRINTTTAAQTGLYYLRVAFPKATNNGYRALIDFWTYNSTKRDIYIELIESNGVSLTGSIAASLYNSSYQNVTTPSVLYNGIVGNSNHYVNISGSSGTATLGYNLYNGSFVTSENVVANDLVFLNISTNKWEKVINGKSIPLGTLVGRVYSTYAANATCGVILQGLHPVPTGVTGLANGNDVYLKGSISSGNFVADGTLVTTLTAGFAYMRLGSVINGQINYDQNNRVYTLSVFGLVAIDNIPFPASLPASGGNADTVDSRHIWTGSQASYDALSSKDSNTLYFIV